MKYIIKTDIGIRVISDSLKDYNISLKQFLDKQSILYGSTMQGRIDAVKSLYNRKGIVPLFINNECVFVFSKSIRNLDVVVINQRRVLSLMKLNQQTKVIFDDLTELVLDIPYTRIYKQYEVSKKLNF